MRSATIIIPIFNESSTLRRALEAVVTQSVLPHKLILVDDGSTDLTPKIIEEYAEQYPFIHPLRNLENLGIFASLKKAFDYVDTEYLAVISGNDFLMPHFLERSIGTLDEYPDAGLSFSSYATYDPSTRTINDLSLDPSTNGAFDLRKYPRYLSPTLFRAQLGGGNIWMSSNAVLYRTKCLIKCGGFQEVLRWYSDWFVNVVIALRYGVCVIPEMLGVISARSALSHSALAYSNQKAQQAVVKNLLKVLAKPTYWDIAFVFSRHPVLFTPLDREVLNTFVRYPIFSWPYIFNFSQYCTNALIPLHADKLAKAYIKNKRIEQQNLSGKDGALIEGHIKSPTISVIMANYNHAKYLRESLSAICSQSRLPNELIIVDDGSTDESISILEEYCKRYKFITLVKNNKNKGQLESIELALGLARGDYINWVAADDRMAPEFLRKSEEMIKNFPGVGVVQSEYALFYEDFGKFHPQKEVAEVFNFGRMPAYFSPWRYKEWLKEEIVWLSTNGALVRRDEIMRMGGYNKKLEWHADWFANQAIALRRGLCVIPEPLTALRVLKTSYSAQGMNNLNRQNEVYKELFRVLNEKNNKDLKTDFLNYPVILSALSPNIYKFMRSNIQCYRFILAYFIWKSPSLIFNIRNKYLYKIQEFKRKFKLNTMTFIHNTVHQLRMIVSLILKKWLDKN